MCSYKKEVLADDYDYNAVTVVIHNEKTDLPGALQWISDRHDEIVESFMKVRDDVLNKRGFPSYGEDVDRQVALYVEGLGQWIRGHDEWNFGSGRSVLLLSVPRINVLNARALPGTLVTKALRSKSLVKSSLPKEYHIISRQISYICTTIEIQ